MLKLEWRSKARQKESLGDREEKESVHFSLGSPTWKCGRMRMKERPAGTCSIILEFSGL